MPQSHTPRLSLAPIPYYWARETVMSFYRHVEEWPVDIVYLGETVCPKRRAVTPEEWVALGERLAATGKEVVLSTLTLIEAGSELGGVRKCCRDSPFTVEANDMAAVGALEALGRDFVAGSTLNLYNQRALRRIQTAGARRWVLPVELGAASAGALIEAMPGLEAEVLAWGRLPLSWSARCFTARAENRARDDCGFACLADPDGRLVRTQEGAPFLTLNGVQTQSALTYNLAGEVSELDAAGVGVWRITPQIEGTEAVVRGFDALRGGASPAATAADLARFAPEGVCNGYWREGAGLEYRTD